MSRIIFLGCAGTIEAMKNGSSAASTYIDVDGNKILIDPGPGTFLRACQNKLDVKVGKILISEKNTICNNDEALFKSYNSDIDIKDVHDEHNEKKSYIIKTSKYILSYLTTPISKKNIEDFKDTNILILKMNSMDEKHAEEIISKLNPEVTILTAYPETLKDSLELSRNIKKAVGKNIQIIPARDGMIINTDSYNIKLKQKSLKGFV